MTGEHTDAAKDGLVLAEELTRALDDPERYEWGDSPWEHLGDAERDVRRLLAALDALVAERDALRDALREITLTPFGGSPEARDMQRIAARALVGDDTKEECPRCGSDEWKAIDYGGCSVCRDRAEEDAEDSRVGDGTA